ncbi:hypothetical protein SL1157_0551 [Ruegeria lacuscaerulensis ITI-1157]|nr:hypothetical protein SL1157_0551 [Ruegeria lacuscaerulensis ITI-1157]SHJ44939.1 hypothetical protein SAMN05444404_2114 [Ruegeria lacuscaerulensis ITI-1157]
MAEALLFLGFFLLASISVCVSSLFLASVFPFFNFKKEYTEHLLRVSGAPPTRLRLLLTVYGANSYFFKIDWGYDSPAPGALKTTPNRNLIRMPLLALATLIFTVFLRVAAFAMFNIIPARI